MGAALCETYATAFGGSRDQCDQERARRYLLTRIGSENIGKLRTKLDEEGPILDFRTRHGLLQWIMNALIEGGFRWDPLHCYEAAMKLLDDVASGKLDESNLSLAAMDG